jgi:pathogenesis-related protein 1
MKTGALKALFGLALCLAANQASAQSPTAMLAPHNTYRNNHCVPKLTWSATLAAAAQAHADKCTKTHDSNRTGGENLSWGTNQTAADAVQGWYNEVNKYNFASPPAKYTETEAAHFTQVVWRSSAQLGCGVRNCGGQNYWVCRYLPGGNIDGQFPANVKPSCLANPNVDSVPRPKDWQKKILQQQIKK